MAVTQRGSERRMAGVHVSFDPEVLAKLDLAAERAGMSRSALLRQVVEEWMEREAEERWVAEKAAEALAEERMPWAETRADLGL